MYIGLDLGTSGLKALLIDDEQRAVAEATAPLSVSRPHPSWSEQDPADWVAAAQTALRGLAQKTSLSGVRGIGLSGQQHGATILDSAHKVLRPAILWNDTRAGAEARQLDEMPSFREITGNICFAGFTAPKLIWAANHEPDVFAQVALVLLPKDYLRLWLTGDAVSEPSDASGTGWLDVQKRTWSPTLLEACRMGEEHMPSLVEGSEVSGGLRQAVADEFGLPAGIPVAGGGGDNASAAVGMGVVEEGPAFVSLGTSGVLFATTPKFSPMAETAVHSFCHAIPRMWHQMGVILAATDALNWLAKLAQSDAVSITADLGPLQAPGRPLFVPYLGGERTPCNDPDARASFIGLAHETDRTAAARAVLEGVTFAVKDSADALAACGTKLDRVIAVGGGSKSRYWLEAIATALGVPVDVPGAGDYGAAFGAARLGAIAAGRDLSFITTPEIAATVDPDPSLQDAFAQAQQRYRATYQALKDLS
ncbi:MAG: xylulokinase [Pseudomonadota bacterium]